MVIHGRRYSSDIPVMTAKKHSADRRNAFYLWNSVLSALCNHNRARCRNCHYSCNRNDHISCVGAAVVCARIVCIGIGNDFGDDNGFAFVVRFIFRNDFSGVAGLLISAVVAAVIAGDLIEEVIIGSAYDKVVELNVAAVVPENDRRRSDRADRHRNICIIDDLFVIEIALDMSGLNSPADRKSGGLLVGSRFYDSILELYLDRLKLVVFKMVASENYRVADIVIFIPPYFTGIFFALILLIVCSVLSSEPKSGTDQR